MFNSINQIDKETKFRKSNFKKNEIIFNEDQICEEMGIIISGEYIIQSLSFNGNEIIYAYLKEGDIFGQNLLFSDNNKYKGNVICINPGEVQFINKNNLLYIFNKYPNILSIFLKKQSNSIISLNNNIKILSFESAEERLIFFLSNTGKYKYDTITKFAKILNLRRETLSRLIVKLIKKDVIYKDDTYIYLK